MTIHGLQNFSIELRVKEEMENSFSLSKSRMQFLPRYVSGSDGSRYHARHLIIMEWGELEREAEN